MSALCCFRVFLGRLFDGTGFVGVFPEFYWLLALLEPGFLLVSPTEEHRNGNFPNVTHRGLSAIQMLICRNQVSQRSVLTFVFIRYISKDMCQVLLDTLSNLHCTNSPLKGREKPFLFA